MTTSGEPSELAAACGLYCGACSIRQAGKRGDAALPAQIAEVLTAGANPGHSGRGCRVIIRSR